MGLRESNLDTLLAALREYAVTSRASDLARSGYRAEADAALLALGSPAGETPGVLDLRARIAAQEGRLRDAGELWSRALALDPNHRAARAGHDRVTGMLAGQARRWSRISRVVAVVLSALVVAAAWAWLERRGGGPEAAGVAGGPLSEASSPTADSDSVPGRAPVADTPSLAGLTLNVPGVNLQRVDGTIVLRFERGLFTEATRLGPGSRTALRDLGRRLAPEAAQIAIEVSGHADAVPLRPGTPYRDNFDLSLARARIVLSLLASSGVPWVTMTARAAGTVEPPFPMDPARADPRNRTVTVVVRPRTRAP